MTSSPVEQEGGEEDELDIITEEKENVIALW
jgi:hypothetical protein